LTMLVRTDATPATAVVLLSAASEPSTAVIAGYNICPAASTASWISSGDRM
jgi:hypothetical protein